MTILLDHGAVALNKLEIYSYGKFNEQSDI